MLSSRPALDQLPITAIDYGIRFVMPPSIVGNERLRSATRIHLICFR